MYFGIDLGTTNSLIGVGDNLLTGLVSSNVDTSTGKQVARDIVSEDIVSSYKTDMSMGVEGKLSVECSAIILRTLADIGSRRYGEEVKDVVISVPAYFSTSQREAVIKAANKVDLNVKALINEPTAAALFVCKDLKDLVVVYDLGGGTFDVSVVDSRTGSYMVIATDGCNVGGDNLDEALTDEIITKCKIPIRFRNKLNRKKLKAKMRLAKETIQKDPADVCINLEDYGVKEGYKLTLERYKELVKEVFGKTISMTSALISRHVPVSENPKMIFVGGSTNCPYLKELVRGEIQLEEVTSEYNPDLIVAKGVSLYADMLYNGTSTAEVEDVTKRLCIEDASGKGITVIESNTIIPYKSSTSVFNTKTGSTLSLKLYQGNSIIAKQNEYIGTLVFNYGREVQPEEGVIDVTVEVNRDGVVVLSAYEVLFGEESMQTVELQAR